MNFFQNYEKWLIWGPLFEDIGKNTKRICFQILCSKYVCLFVTLV